MQIAMAREDIYPGLSAGAAYLVCQNREVRERLSSFALKISILGAVRSVRNSVRGGRVRQLRNPGPAFCGDLKFTINKFIINGIG